MVDVALHFDILHEVEVRCGRPRWAMLSGLANTTRSGAAIPAHEWVGSAAPTYTKEPLVQRVEPTAVPVGLGCSRPLPGANPALETTYARRPWGRRAYVASEREGAPRIALYI